MSRSNHDKRRISYSKESSYGRFIFRRRTRARHRDALKNERYDDIIEPKGTQGWLTW